jgi:hypothetical protein
MSASEMRDLFVSNNPDCAKRNPGYACCVEVEVDAGNAGCGYASRCQGGVVKRMQLRGIKSHGRWGNQCRGH